MAAQSRTLTLTLTSPAFALAVVPLPRCRNPARGFCVPGNQRQIDMNVDVKRVDLFHLNDRSPLACGGGDRSNGSLPLLHDYLSLHVRVY